MKIKRIVQFDVYDTQRLTVQSQLILIYDTVGTERILDMRCVFGDIFYGAQSTIFWI